MLAYRGFLLGGRFTMRKDLAAVVTEPERYGHTKSFKGVRRRSTQLGEDAPTRESMTKHYNGPYEQRKESKLKFRPLRGLVSTWVGRPWDKFYSALRSTYDVRRRVNHEIFDFIDSYVEHKRIYVGDDGTLMVRVAWRGAPDVPVSQDRSLQFYVDPTTGLICKNKAYRTRKQAEADREERAAQARANVFREIDDSTVMHRIDGVWHVYTMQAIPGTYVEYQKPESISLFDWRSLSPTERMAQGVKTQVVPRVYDFFYGQTVKLGRNYLGWESNSEVDLVRYHATKKTASHKLLKQMGLVA
jgi:hypothetical protein